MRRPPLARARLEPVEEVVRDREVEDADVVGALRGVALSGGEALVGVLAGVVRREVDLDEDLRAAQLAGAALQELGQSRTRAAPAVVRVDVDLGPDLVGVVVHADVQGGDTDDAAVASTAQRLRALGRVLVAPLGERLLEAVAVVPRPLEVRRHDAAPRQRAVGVVVDVDEPDLGRGQGGTEAVAAMPSTVEGRTPRRQRFSAYGPGQRMRVSRPTSSRTSPSQTARPRGRGWP